MPKLIRVLYNITPAHKRVLRILAERNDTNSATMIRRLIREEAQRQGIWSDNNNQKNENAEEQAAEQ